MEKKRKAEIDTTKVILICRGESWSTNDKGRLWENRISSDDI